MVLVDESVAGLGSSDRSAGPILDDFGIVRCALAERAVPGVGAAAGLTALCRLDPETDEAQKFCCALRGQSR